MIHTRPNMKKWNDKRYWRGFQRQVAREHILKEIERYLEYLLIRDITPANTLRAQEVKSIASMIKRRKLSQRNK